MKERSFKVDIYLRRVSALLIPEIVPGALMQREKLESSQDSAVDNPALKRQLPLV